MKKSICFGLCFLFVLVTALVTEAKPKPVKIAGLKAGSELPYEVGLSLEKETKYYIDRDYTVIAMPEELVGIQFIMTAN